ncbi:hypothetical protein LCGC14_1324940 [marine sediment metagenome]|uniref:Uncharacterized protein n=1 Tax=marine sediment metagenome TaxID=412755 RepID=A0A0F9KIH7_9ZZZZ
MGNWLKSVWEGVSKSRSLTPWKQAQPDRWDWDRIVEELGLTQREVLNLAAHGGNIMIKDIVPQDEDNEEVSSKTWIDVSGQTALETCTTSTLDVIISITSSFPMCKINDTTIELDEATDEGHYEKDINFTLPAGATDISVNLLLPNDTLGAGYTTTVDIVSGPTLLTLHFTGGYLGSQTEMKVGDTFQITGTTDVPCVAARVLDFGACTAAVQGFPSANTFVITATIDTTGYTPVALAAKVQARNADGAYGPVAVTTLNGGAVDGYNTIICNDTVPTFIDSDYTNDDNPGATAFKGTEEGTQSTVVADYDTVLYSSATSDFTITDPNTYSVDKIITLTNPGDYNDSENNFKITANRAANDATEVFEKIIEVADTAPILTVTQPAASLRSEGTYTITVTSDQNLNGAPDLNIAVGGTWQGGGFAGSDKIWTRDLLIEHDDARGTTAWTQVSPAENNAGVGASITGDNIIGGFLEMEITFNHDPAWNLEPLENLSEVVDVTNLICEDNAGHALAYQAGVGDNPYTFTITDAGGTPDVNGNYLRWTDLDAVGANTTGTAYLKIEETL